MKKLSIFRKKRKGIAKYIFIFINILFLVACCFFYVGRLYTNYRIEHPKIKENETIYTLATLEKNIVTIGNGVYKNGDNYTYKGSVNNNYVLYSGILWRIMSTDNGNVKLISDEVLTSLVSGKNTFDKSYTKEWLNSENYFYGKLKNKDILVPTKVCIDAVSSEKITCDNVIEVNVGTISIDEYNNAGASSSYLNINSYFWTSNVDSDNNNWYVYQEGLLNNIVSSSTTYYSYGVRPVITIKGDTKILRGEGTISNPYSFDYSSSNLLNTKYVGNYIDYSNHIWRIIDTNENYTKLVMEEVITNGEDEVLVSYNNIAKYLNNDFYNTLTNKDIILEYSIPNGIYDKSRGYDFKNIFNAVSKVKVGLLNIGELFINSQDNYVLWTSTKASDATYYQVLTNGKLYVANKNEEAHVRPVIYIKPDITVEGGSGTKVDPYRVR